MSGIAGIICSHPVAKESTETLIAKMLKSIVHRGPDESDMAYATYGGLGVQRLVTIDPRGGRQAFYHPEKPYILVFDGEITNFRTLRTRLESKGIELMTQSDAEVLMMLYGMYDDQMFRELEGAYTLAMWNGERKELIVARDPLGKKPLYYEMDEHGIAFASELKAILQVRSKRPDLNETALQYYLALQYIPSPMTMFEGIYKLPPGYMLRWRITDESLEVWPTWMPDDEVSKELLHNRNLSMESALKEFDARLRHSLSQQVKVSETPVGVFLSGGLSSATVAALATQYSSTPLHTYSVGYQYSKKNQDESAYARGLATALGATHHEMELGLEALDDLPQILWHMDEPLADPALLTLDALGKMAGKNAPQAIITGHGGSGLLGGHPKYRQYNTYLQLKQWPAPFRKALLPLVDSMALSLLGWERWQLLKSALGDTDPVAIWQTYRNFPESERRKLLVSGQCILDKRFRVYAKGAYDPYVQLQWDDLHHGLPHNHLAALDKTAMKSHVETRTPFLDHHLVSWCMGLPQALKWRGAQNNYLLREYARQLLPKGASPSPASGCFDLPLDAWLYTRFGEGLSFALLESPFFQETNILSRPYVQKLIAQYEAGALKSAQPIWNLWVLATWYEVFTRCNTKDDLWNMKTMVIKSY